MMHLAATMLKQFDRKKKDLPKQSLPASGSPSFVTTNVFFFS
jgi:hypothetical protein